MEQVQFREEQGFGVWVDVLSLTAMGGAAAGQLITLAGEATSSAGALAGWALFWAVILMVMANLFRMTTEVDHHEVRVTFGRWFPYYRKRVPLDTIVNSRAVTYRPLRDAGGWGIRWGRFEGHRCAYLNTSGNRGVLLELDGGKRLIIGSAVPESLQMALVRAGAER